MNAVILVEGVSDQLALEALAARRGRDLEAEGVSIVPIGGAHAIGHALRRFGPGGDDLKLAGLCDAGEEGAFTHGLERAGLGTNLSRSDLEALGFFVCDTDLEHELVRALGAGAVLKIVEEQGELSRSAPSRSSRPSGSSTSRSSYGDLCGTGRSATRRCSWTRLISIAFRARSTAS